MMEGVTRRGWLRPGGPLRTSQGAAIAGIIFGVFLITALVLLRVSVPAHSEVAGAWLTDSRRRAAVAVALNLIPFAGIAFLWFIGVLRDRIGDREDRLFATVFLGSGLLDTMIKYVQQEYLNERNGNDFLIMAFTSAATLGTVLLLAAILSGRQRLNIQSILAGIAIGLPNYFSIWSLGKVITAYKGNSSAIIPVNNMGIVLFSAVAAWLLFKERLSLVNWIGIALAIAAIALIAYG